MSEVKNQILKVLKGYDIGEIVSVSDQSHGYANRNYSVETTQTRLFVRFCIQQTLSNVQQEILLMSVLKGRSFKTAYPVERIDGEFISFTDKTPVVVYEYLEGDLPTLNEGVVAEIAKTTADLSVTDYPDKLNKKNAISLDDSRELVISNAFRKFNQKDVKEKFSHLLDILTDRISIDVPVGIVHGDIFPDNTLFIDNSLVALIDFEEFAIDNLLFDIGMTINGFCFNGIELETGFLRKFLKEYYSVRKFSKIEVELITDYMAWGAVGMSSWHLHQLLHRKNRKQLERVRLLLKRAEWILNERENLESVISGSLWKLT